MWGTGADNSNGVNFEHHRSYYHSIHLLLVSEELLPTLILQDKIFFMILYMYIVPGQGQITLDDKISYVI